MKNTAPHETEKKSSARERSAVDEITLIRPFSQALPTKFLRAREAVISRFRPILQARRITDQQWRILRALAELEEAEILTLSDWCVIHPASLSRILPKMEAGGLIKRRTNVADKRRVIVSLDEKGRALFDEVAPESEAAYETLIEAAGPERLKELNRILDELLDVLNSSGVAKPS